MEDISIGVPKPVLERLPEGSEDTQQDMQQAVAGWERRLNSAIDAAADDREAAGHVLDAIDLFERRMERYDEFVPELRAWGQSPIYAIAWRTLYADLIAQLYEHEELREHVDVERNARLVEDGIRFGDR